MDNIKNFFKERCVEKFQQSLALVKICLGTWFGTEGGPCDMGTLLWGTCLYVRKGHGSQEKGRFLVGFSERP